MNTTSAKTLFPTERSKALRGSEFTLTVDNPTAKGMPKNVAYVNQANQLQLKIGNKTGYPIDIGPGQIDTMIGFTVSKNIIDAKHLQITTAVPWEVKGQPVDNGTSWLWQLAPTKTVTIPDQGQITIDIKGFTPTAQGLGNLGVQLPQNGYQATDSLTVKAATPKNGDQLFGTAKPLKMNFTVNNNNQQSPIFTSAPVTVTSFKLPNELEVEIVFQDKNLPKPALNEHPGLLMGKWDPQNPPFFEIYFPCFTATDSKLPRYNDLTDAFKVGEPGYNGWTSAWNINCSLSKTDNKKTSDTFWKIELVTSNPFPVWKVTPLTQAVFSTPGPGEPGPTLNLFFSDIYTDLEVDATKHFTYLYLNWYNFIDLSPTNAPLVEYNDGGTTDTINKLLSPDILDFNLIPGTYTASNGAEKYQTTFEQNGIEHAVFPYNAKLEFKFRWYVQAQKGSEKQFDVILAPPGGLRPIKPVLQDDPDLDLFDDNEVQQQGEMEAIPEQKKKQPKIGNQFIVSYSKRYTIDTATDLPLATKPWTLEVEHTTTKTVVSKKEITPFLPIRDYLKSYLVGRIYSKDGAHPSQQVYLLAFLSSEMALWQDPVNSSSFGVGKWKLSQTGPGVLTISLTNTPATFNYNVYTDSFSQNGATNILKLATHNWQGLSNFQLPLQGFFKPALQLIGRKIFRALESDKSKSVYLTSSNDGWTWTRPNLVVTGPQVPPSLPGPAMAYFYGQFTVAFVTPDAPQLKVTSSTDGKTWSTPETLNVAPVQSIQMFTDSFAQYIYCMGQDHNYHLIFKKPSDTAWTYAACPVPTPPSITAWTGWLFEYQGEKMVLVIEEAQSVVLKRLSVEDNGGPVKQLSFTTLGYLAQLKLTLDHVGGMELSTGQLVLTVQPIQASYYDTQFYLPSDPLAQKLPVNPSNAINYSYGYSMLSYFRDSLFRIVNLYELSNTLTLKSYLTWPKNVAGPSNPGISTSMTSMAVNGQQTLFLAYVDPNNKVKVAISPTGTNWQVIDPGVANQVSGVSIFQFEWDLWMAFVDSSTQEVYTLQSKDGVTWDQQQLVSSNLKSLAAPAFGITPSTETLYMAFPDQKYNIQIFIAVQQGNVYSWKEDTANSGLDLPTTSHGMSIASFKGKIFMLIRRIDNKLSLYFTNHFGFNWQYDNTYQGVSSDVAPSLLVHEGQLQVFFKNLGDNILYKQRNVDGVNWEAPESLYMTITQSPSACVCRNQLYIAAQDTHSPQMVSILHSDAIVAGGGISPSFVEELSQPLQGFEVIGTQTYAPTNGDPLQKATYLLMTDVSKSTYFIFKKQIAGAPFPEVTWQNIRQGALPAVPAGYRLSQTFVVAPSQDILLTATQSTLDQDEIWLLKKGSNQYNTAYGKQMLDIALNPKTKVVYGAHASGAVQYRNFNSGSWQDLPVTLPPANNILNITISNLPLIEPTRGYHILPASSTNVKGNPVANTHNQVNFSNTLAQQVFYAALDNTGKPGPINPIGASAYLTIDAPSGSCFAVYSDQAGKTVLNYYQLVPVPFKHLTCNYQGRLLGIHQGAETDGRVYLYDEPKTSWVDTGIRGVAISSDNSGHFCVATQSGQLLRLIVDNTTGAIQVVAFADTYLHRIRQLTIDAAGVHWILSNNHKLYRSNDLINSTTDRQVAITVFNKQLYMAYRQDGRVLLTASMDGASWSMPIDTGVTSDYAPSISNDGQQLWLAWVSNSATATHDNAIYVMPSHDGIVWQIANAVDTSGSTDQPFELIHSSQAGNRLEYVNRGFPNLSTIFISYSDNNGPWAGATIDPQYKTAKGPVIATFKQLTFVAFLQESTNEVIVLSSPDLKTWTKVNLGTTYTSPHAPALTVYTNQAQPVSLVLGFTDEQGMVRFLTSQDGTTFTKAKPTNLNTFHVPHTFVMVYYGGTSNTAQQLYVLFVDESGVVRSRVVDGV